MNQQPKTEEAVKKDFSKLMASLKKFFSELVDLQAGIDREGTIIYIQNNKRMRGSSAWLLMCSIMIASLGLDLDSPAVIIGAMLISPLMSPILGVGMGIGTNDRESLVVSLQHFGVAIAIALITSFIYFWINPLGQENATKEIIDRTEPSLLAGMVAIFGGVAGIISASRKDQSNAIPGVAIATALMPPLCVAGYGLARAEYLIFWNAFYLFFLNSFFIAISTFVLIRYMKFPVKAHQNKKESRRTAILIAVVSILMTLPSVYILKRGYEKKQHEQLVSRFISDHFGHENNPQSIGHSFTESDSSNVLAIKLLGKQIDTEQIKAYEKELDKMGIKNTKIFPLQDESFDLEKLDNIQKEMKGYEKIVTQLELTDNKMFKASKELTMLRNELDSIHRDTVPIFLMNKDVTTLLDATEGISYGYKFIAENGKLKRKTILYVKWKENSRPKDRIVELEKLKVYCAKELKGIPFEIQIEG